LKQSHNLSSSSLFLKMQGKSDRIQNNQNKVLITKIYNKIDNLKSLMSGGGGSEIESVKLGLTKNNAAMSCDEIIETNTHAVSGY